LNGQEESSVTIGISNINVVTDLRLFDELVHFINTQFGYDETRLQLQLILNDQTEELLGEIGQLSKGALGGGVTTKMLEHLMSKMEFDKLTNKTIG
jgi:hypothetical protein